MERADVISLLGRLKQAYPQAYAKMPRTEAEELVSLWSDMLGSEDPASPFCFRYCPMAGT